jgi:hypothetical protein
MIDQMAVLKKFNRVFGATTKAGCALHFDIGYLALSLRIK